MIGERYGRLIVENLSSERYYRQRVWNCRCDCGDSASIPTRSLRSGKTQSCGCLRLERFNQAMVKEIDGDITKRHPLYNTWTSMKQRCYNPVNKDYWRYGGRGVEVCKDWFYSFGKFVEDMGERPEGHTLDRIDNNGPYSPDNCKWSTKSEQNLNRGGY